MKPERLSRNIIYQSPWVNLYLDKVEFPNGLVSEKFHSNKNLMPLELLKSQTGHTLISKSILKVTVTCN